MNGDTKITFAYDYLGRRVEKKLFAWTGSGWSATPSLVRRFVWSGWLMLMEVDCGTGFQPVRKYTWGLDLAGQAGSVNSLEQAGGIGGLLAVEDTNGTPGTGGDDLKYVYTYDGNGNVVQVLDYTAASAAASIKARYEYDPYGNVLTQAGDYAATNPMRFSTKYWEEDTGMGYWGYRYYWPTVGRWISRDPIAEQGGLNLYVFVRNCASGGVDDLGAQFVLPGGSRGYKRVCIDPSPQRPEAPKTELTNPLCGLTHFCFGGGGDACLSQDLVNALKQTQQYRILIGTDIADVALADLLSDNKGPCSKRTKQWHQSGKSSNLLTSPYISMPQGGLARDPGYCFSLNNTIGTIRDIDWSADCTTTAVGPRACGNDCVCPVVADCTLRITITDTYDFRGTNNILLRWIPGRAFVITNTFTDRFKGALLFPCSAPTTSK